MYTPKTVTLTLADALAAQIDPRFDHLAGWGGASCEPPPAPKKIKPNREVSCDREAARLALRGWRLREDRDGRLSERWRLSSRATLYYASAYGNTVAGFACRVEDLSIRLDPPRVSIGYRQDRVWCARYYHARLRDIAAGRATAHDISFGFLRGVRSTQQEWDYDDLIRVGLRDVYPHHHELTAVAYRWNDGRMRRVAPRTAEDRFLLEHYRRVAAEQNSEIAMQPARVIARVDHAVKQIREYVREQKNRKAS